MAQRKTVRMLYVFALLALPAASHAEEKLKAWWARTPPSIEEEADAVELDPKTDWSYAIQQLPKRN